MGAPHDVTPLTVYNAFCRGVGVVVMYLWTVTASQGGAGVSTGVDGCPGGVRTEGDEWEGGDGGASCEEAKLQEDHFRSFSAFICHFHPIKAKLKSSPPDQRF